MILEILKIFIFTINYTFSNITSYIVFDLQIAPFHLLYGLNQWCQLCLETILIEMTQLYSSNLEWVEILSSIWQSFLSLHHQVLFFLCLPFQSFNLFVLNSRLHLNLPHISLNLHVLLLLHRHHHRSEILFEFHLLDFCIQSAQPWGM